MTNRTLGIVGLFFALAFILTAIFMPPAESIQWLDVILRVYLFGVSAAGVFVSLRLLVIR